MITIIAGKYKGSTLFLTKDKNTRPLKDLVRENIFNLLVHSNKILFEFEQSHILDLYSGTGSFGLECLSRQAYKVCFVEKEKSTIKILKGNIEKLKLEKKTLVINKDVFKLNKKQGVFGSKFDLIFCDPPFKDTNIKKLIELIFNKDLLKKNGIIITHRNQMTKEQLPNFFKIVDERIYGISKITFGKILS